jgi:hypothetical protein
MKKLLRFVGVSFAVSFAATQANAVTYNLGALISSGDSFTIGDKIFDDFGFASAQFNANDATVTPAIDGNGVYHLHFQGPWVALPGQMADINLNYTVATTSGEPLIEAIGQSYVLSVAGGGGFNLIGETVRTGSFAGPTTAQSSLSFVTGDPGLTDLEDPVAEPLTGDDLIVNPTEAKLWVTKDIFFGANRTGLIGPTTITQSYYQVSMPEGGTTALSLGLVLGGIGLVRRKLIA